MDCKETDAGESESKDVGISSSRTLYGRIHGKVSKKGESLGLVFQLYIVRRKEVYGFALWEKSGSI